MKKILAWLMLTPVILYFGVRVLYVSIESFYFLDKLLQLPGTYAVYIAVSLAICLFFLWIPLASSESEAWRDKCAALLTSGYVLRLFAVFVWLMSLPLVGVIDHRETHNGFEILMQSPVAFLALGGTAAYTNIFFWILVFSKSTRPVWRLTIMWLLTLSMFLLNELPYGAGGGRSTFYSWGWGAVLWLVAQILLTAVFFVREARPWLAQGVALALGALLVAGVAALGAWQRSVANSDELARFFPRGTAITMQRLSGIPYHPYPEELRLPADAGLVFVNHAGSDKWAEDARLLPYGGFAAPPGEARPGYYYQRVEFKESAFFIGHYRAQTDYLYQLSHLGSNGELTATLADGNGASIWQQPQVRRGERGFYPGRPNHFLARHHVSPEGHPLHWQAACWLEGGRDFLWQQSHIIAEDGLAFLPQALCRADYTLLFARGARDGRYAILADTASGDILGVYRHYPREGETVPDFLPQRATLENRHDNPLTLYGAGDERLEMDDGYAKRFETTNRHNLHR